MPLSHKNVYKQPPIFGDCSYESEGFVCEPDFGGHEFQFEQAVDNGSDRGEVVFWSDPELEKDSLDLEERGQAAEEKEEIEYNLEEDIEAENDNRIRAAKCESKKKEDIEAAAISKAEKLLEERFEKCVKDGYEQGKFRAEEECRSMKEKAESSLREAELTLREAKQRSKEIIASSEKKIVELAVAVAERLVYRQIEVEPETITSIARETMNMLNEGTQVDLYVNPADLEKCFDYREFLTKEYPDINKLEVLPDPQLPRGSCRVESESGVVEYLIDEEKEQLKEMLLKIARNEEKRMIEEGVPAYDRH
ncbi:MAG: FliH/SctL family protein [Bacillota bacterium]